MRNHFCVSLLPIFGYLESIERHDCHELQPTPPTCRVAFAIRNSGFLNNSTILRSVANISVGTRAFPSTSQCQSRVNVRVSMLFECWWMLCQLCGLLKVVKLRKGLESSRMCQWNDPISDWSTDTCHKNCNTFHAGNVVWTFVGNVPLTLIVKPLSTWWWFWPTQSVTLAPPQMRETLCGKRTVVYDSLLFREASVFEWNERFVCTICLKLP